MKLKSITGCLCALPLAMTLVMTSPAVSAAPVADRATAATNEALEFPVVTLQDWKNSTVESRYGFLVGFTSAIQLEKEWQGKRPLRLQDSLNNTWSKGFDNVSMKSIYDNINAYVMNNPNNLRVSVVEYLWYAYAQPTVNEKVSDQKLQNLDYRNESREVGNIVPAIRRGN